MLENRVFGQAGGVILSRWIKKKLAGLKRETACAMHTQFCNYMRFAGCEVAV